MTRTATVTGFALTCLVAGAPSAPPKNLPQAPAPRPIAAGDGLEFVLLDPARVVRVRLDVRAEGRPIAAVWDDTFARLVSSYDRDGDGSLDRAEAARLPSAFSLRQVLWGRSAPHTGRPLPWAELDRNGDGKVTVGEVADFYRSAGLGGVTAALGRASSTDALTAALLKHLDADGDGTVGAAEWRTAATRLQLLDRDGNEMITPEELVPRVTYPGLSGATPLLAAQMRDDAPVMVLPADRADTTWTAALVRRRDRGGDGRLGAAEAGLTADVFKRLDTDADGRLTPAELTAWRDLAPDANWVAEMGPWPDGKPGLARGKDTPSAGTWLEPDAGRTRFVLRPDAGQLPAAMTTARKRLLDLFSEADTDRDGHVAAGDLTKRSLYELQQLLAVADRNGDGRLSAAERSDWLDGQDHVARGHVLLNIADHGAGLFDLLDADHDGGLSVGELESAAERLKAAGVTPDGRTNRPRVLLATLSRGHPVNPVGRPHRAGPDWFRAMDRNGDGDVSRAEFTGPAAVFDKLDTDRNGRLSPEEAARAK